MKSAVETLSPTRVRLTIEVPFEELKPSLDAAYKEISKQIVLPGFRKGKVPPALIDQHVGRQAVLGQAVNDAVPRLYVNALQENNVEPLSQPDIEGLEEEPVDGDDLKFTAEVDIKPEITLPEYHGIEASVEDADVSDEHVEERLNGLRERFGTLQPADDRPAREGDHVTIDLSGSKDGEDVEELQATGMSYRVGSGTLLDGLDEVLPGMEKDAEATFKTTPKFGAYADQELDVKVKVTSVKEQDLPALDDEFAQLASEFDTLDELRADLREQEERTHRLQQAQEARDAVLEKLLELVDIPLPEKVVQEEIEARRNSILQQLAQVGLTMEQYLDSEDQTAEEFDADLEKRAKDAMRGQFLLDEIAEKEEVSVSQEELTRVIIERARQSGMSPQDYMQQVVENNQVQLFVRDVARTKALAAVVDAAVVTDASGNPVDLKRLQPDGTIAEESEVSEESGEGDGAAEGEATATADATEATEATEAVETEAAAETDEKSDK